MSECLIYQIKPGRTMVSAISSDALYREQVRSTYGGVGLQLTPSKWENARGPPYVLHDGPPYANGHLHMGIEAHALLMRDSERFQAMHSTRS